MKDRTNEISECSLDDKSSEVATSIAGYVAKKLKKRSKCSQCQTNLSVRDADVSEDSYLSLLSRGGLFVPSKRLSDFVCHSFAILDLLEKDLFSMSGAQKQVRDVASYVKKSLVRHQTSRAICIMIGEYISLPRLLSTFISITNEKGPKILLERIRSLPLKSRNGGKR